MGGLFACPFRKDFLQSLAIEGKLGACVLSHLFRHFEPVHGHESSITPPSPFRKELAGTRPRFEPPLGPRSSRSGGDCRWPRHSQVPSRHSDQQIGERKADAFRLVLAVDLAGAKSDWHSDRMDGQSYEEFLNKLVPFRFSLWRVRAGGSVGQFDQSHDGDADLRVTHFA